MKRQWLAFLALPVLACGASAQPEQATTNVPNQAAPAAKAYSSPGGMWMPQQLVDHAQTLKTLGLEVPVETLADPLQAPLGAIVSLGGCSASFVSPEGLIITNHHCVQGALQYHSSPEANYVDTGFLAKNKSEEKWNGPTAKVWVTQAITDVTSTVLGGIDAIEDDKERYEEIEKREKKLVATCEKDRPHIRCRVAGYYQGAEYKLIEQLEIKDIRLVYAPHSGIGWFGGDEDNWMWPRHTGDYSFYRAYVGPDGKPAEFSDKNVPYQPKHHLKIASSNLKEGDLVMVAGYPGRTYRHKTAFEVSDAVEWSYPRKIALYEEYLEVLRAVGEKDPEAKIKAQNWIFGLENALKNNRGMMDGLAKGGLAAEKQELEKNLRAWIQADPQRQEQYGDVLAQLEEISKESMQHRERDAAFGELGFSKLLGTASMIVRLAEERPKADADRDPGYQKRNWDRMRAGLKTFDKQYNRTMDMALFAKSLDRAAKNPEVAKELASLIGVASLTEKEINARLQDMYKKSTLEAEKTRLSLFDKATTKSLKKSKDPFIQLALKLRPLQKEMEDRAETQAGKLSLLKPKYIAALRAFQAGPMAPDANSTLRVTYGTVQGYKPTPEADMYNPFTVVSEVVGKHRDEKPFDVPDALLAAAKEGRFGNYVDPNLGQVPVNFLSNVDTTGGNSGSATLNGKGELVGLLFDGNYESMASDWIFIPELTRAIHCDIRYAMWIMDAVDGADHLLVEMGVDPSVQ